MNLLLDTHVFLWWCDRHRHLTREARQAIADPDNTVFFSVASAWELAIKQALGRVRIPEAVEDTVLSNDFSPLGINFEHARVASLLPRHHADPFDRMLIAQARVDGLTFVTHDSSVRPYDVAVLWT
jgi:PIN domain nuclease of toxin-antitoxin system